MTPTPTMQFDSPRLASWADVLAWLAARERAGWRAVNVSATRKPDGTFAVHAAFERANP